MAEVKVINPIDKNRDNRTRVAAYCRVSSDSEEQLDSFISQVRYYSDYERTHPDIILVNIYADEGITGTKLEKRTEFKKMISDCHKGKIDMIITKAVSRFARNAKDCLTIIRQLKEIGVYVYFEQENINTKDMSGEMLVALFGAKAQEESNSISNNMKWSYEKRIPKGDFNTCKAPFGFRLEKGELTIYEEEAKIVRWIFEQYLSGVSKSNIAKQLNCMGIEKRYDNNMWSTRTIDHILQNERYCGEAILQKKCTTKTFPYKKVWNNGLKQKYHVANANDAIITREIFMAARKLNEARAHKSIGNNEYPLTKYIICKECGSILKRRTNNGKVYWVCSLHDKKASLCPAKQVNETEIYSAFITMYNKLKANSKIILTPILKQINDIRINMRSGNTTFIGIERQIAELREQQLIITRLKNKGIFDEEIFHTQNNDIITKIQELTREKKEILNCEHEDEIIINIKELIVAIENGPERLSDFNEELFDTIVEKAFFTKEDKVIFRLLGGLEFSEQTERNKR